MRIEHIALFCKDLEQMRQFFLDHFEAESNELYHNPRTGLRTFILTFPNGGARLELMQRPDTSMQTHQSLISVLCTSRLP